MLSHRRPQTRPLTDGTTANCGKWPWDPDQSIAAKLAVESLQKFLVKSLGKDGRLHVETLFTAVGALAGFATQHAVRQEWVASGRASEDQVFSIVEAGHGERFYFGDRLNAILVPERLESLTVFSVLGGEALRLGAQKHELPDCMEIFDRVVKSIGTPEFGTPQWPLGHRAWLLPRRAVEIFWPAVLTALTRRPIVPVTGFKLVEPRHWPLVLACVAAGYMSLAKAALAPQIAVELFMGAAIPMSKIDPANIKFAGNVEH